MKRTKKKGKASQTNLLKQVFVILLCCCLLLPILGGCNVSEYAEEQPSEAHSETITPTQINGIPQKRTSIWTDVTQESLLVEKTAVGATGKQLRFSVDFSQLSENVLSETGIQTPNEDIRIDWLAQYMVSTCAFEYEHHFATFQPEIRRSMIDSEFQKYGYSYSTAIEKIHTTVTDVFGLGDCEVRIVLSDIKFNDPTVRESAKSYKSRWTDAGLDFEQIENFISYEFQSAVAYYENELFYIDFEKAWEDVVVLYQYGGEWYVQPNRMDDDLSIDFLLSQKGEDNGYYVEKMQEGEVVRIEENYVFLKNGNCFLLPKEYSDLKNGDWVKVMYVGIGGSAYNCSDSERWKIYVALSLERK